MSPLQCLMNWRRLAVAVLLLSLLSLANAAYVLVGPQGFRDGGGSLAGATAGAFCNASAAPFGSGTTGTSLNVREHGSGQMITDCNYTGGPFGPGTHFVDSAGFGYCPAGGGVFAGGGGNCWNTVSECPEGSEPGAGGFCSAPTGCAASAGTTREVNFTLGWTRTANADDYGFVGGQAAIPTSACHGGCTVGILTAQRTWVSPAPSLNGLYRHSADLLVIGTDSSCTTTTPAMEPTTENADCDGTVGYVNGKRTCVKGSSAPDPVAPAPAPEKIGNPSAGSQPNPTDNDNPAGREPTGGNGGNDGGPPSGDTAGEPRGSGTGPVTGGAGGSQTIKVEIPDFKDPCGIPGSPPCKIDETGTPTDPELDPAQAAEDAVAAAREFAENPTSALPAHPDLNWTFALPTGCSAIAIDGFGDFISSIDVCPWQDMFHELMSIVWIMGGLFGAISHFFRNVYSQG